LGESVRTIAFEATRRRNSDEDHCYWASRRDSQSRNRFAFILITPGQASMLYDSPAAAPPPPPICPVQFCSDPSLLASPPVGRFSVPFCHIEIFFVSISLLSANVTYSSQMDSDGGDRSTAVAGPGSEVCDQNVMIPKRSPECCERNGAVSEVVATLSHSLCVNALVSGLRA
jgi:hypothetical protein